MDYNIYFCDKEYCDCGNDDETINICLFNDEIDLLLNNNVEKFDKSLIDNENE